MLQYRYTAGIPKGKGNMGIYSVPENIRKLKPKGTMVKAIKGKYYVYEQKHIKENDKWKIKMGKMIGSIDQTLGFIPNDNFFKDGEITTVDFGEYFLTASLSIDTLNKLKSIFNIKDAQNIYNLALIHFVNGFTYTKNIKPIYDLSYLSMKYPSLSLSEHIVSNMLDNLGRRQTKVEQFEDLLISESTKEFAVDGHAIKSSSHDNALSEEGNKNNIFRDRQINLLMAYDINTNRPVLSRMYDGSALDKISIRDLFERRNYCDTLFIIDKGFYSTKNIDLLSENNNKYIIPLMANTTNYKKIVKNLTTDNLFIYQRGKKKTAIEYKEIIVNDKTKVMFFRDQTESAIESADYLSKVDGINDIYTIESYNRHKDFFGTIVLESNLDKPTEEIYKLYKRRWAIETFYDYYKNRLDVNALHLPDYYQTQGLSFIMLITSLIYSDINQKIKGLNKSITDLLLETRFLKLHKKQGKWKLENTSKKHYELFEKLNIDLYKEIDFLNSLSN